MLVVGLADASKAATLDAFLLVWYNGLVTKVNIDCCKKEPFCYAGRLFPLTKSLTIFDFL